MILQKLEYLDQVFHQAHFDEDYFRYLIETQKNACFRNQESFNDQPQKFRVLLDPAKGIQSFIHKKIETVGDPDKRFGEDALRLIRALRIVNICNKKLLTLQENDQKVKLFDYQPELWDSLKKNAPLIQHVAKERIKDELTKVFQKGDPF